MLMGAGRGQRNRALRLQHLERLQAPGELSRPTGIDEAELRADLAPQRGAALACTVCHNVTETRLGLGRTKGLENLTLGPHGRELHTSGHPLSSTRCGDRAELAGERDPEQTLTAETTIWQIWLDGGEPSLNEGMARGILAMNTNRLDDAVERFTELIQAAPEFAEAWNKRATVYYLMERYEDSVRDIERTLALEPRHFGAISGMGLIFLQLGDEIGALDAFEKVLEIHPHARGARFHVERLRERLRGKQI